MTRSIVYDIFNGAPAPGTLLGHTAVSTSYTVHKDILVPAGIAGCVDVDNTATFKDANPNNTPSNSSSVTTHVCVAGHDLTIKKTVAPSYTRTFTWTIDKKVNGKDSDGPISSDQPTVPAHYTVVTTKTGANHGYKLAGTITVTNPNSFAVSGATVTDQAPAGFTCTVTGGALGSIAPGASVAVKYTCTYAPQTAPTTGTNHATVTWSASSIPNNSTGHTSAGADASYDFATAAVTLEHNAVDVLDTNTEHEPRHGRRDGRYLHLRPEHPGPELRLRHHPEHGDGDGHPLPAERPRQRHGVDPGLPHAEGPGAQQDGRAGLHPLVRLDDRQVRRSDGRDDLVRHGDVQLHRRRDQERSHR